MPILEDMKDYLITNNIEISDNIFKKTVEDTDSISLYIDGGRDLNRYFYITNITMYIRYDFNNVDIAGEKSNAVYEIFKDKANIKINGKHYYYFKPEKPILDSRYKDVFVYRLELEACTYEK